MAKTDLTAQRLRELLHYDPETGVFRWLVRPSNRVRVGSIAGSRGKHYIEIGVDGLNFFAHRLAWLYMLGAFPIDGIDHRDRDRYNNRWGNLRPATQKQNGENLSLRRDNSSGLRGVNWIPAKGKWRARIVHNRTDIHLGMFQTKELALEARLRAEKNLYTHATEIMA
jgi:hypothetical protein